MKIWTVVAVVLFIVAAVLVIVGGFARTVELLTLVGLAAVAMQR